MSLAASEWKLRAIIEAEPECVKVLDPEGRLLQMNRAGLDMVDADSGAEVLGRRMCEWVAPEYRDAFRAVSEQVMRGDAGRLEFEMIGLKGGRRWLDTHAVPMRDVDGNITGLLAVTRDVTERKAIERRLEHPGRRTKRPCACAQPRQR